MKSSRNIHLAMDVVLPAIVLENPMMSRLTENVGSAMAPATFTGPPGSVTKDNIWATNCPYRNPQWKLYSNLGHAKNALYNHSGSLWQRVGEDWIQLVDGNLIYRTAELRVPAPRYYSTVNALYRQMIKVEFDKIKPNSVPKVSQVTASRTDRLAALTDEIIDEVGFEKEKLLAYLNTLSREEVSQLVVTELVLRKGYDVRYEEAMKEIHLLRNKLSELGASL